MKKPRRCHFPPSSVRLVFVLWDQVHVCAGLRLGDFCATGDEDLFQSRLPVRQTENATNPHATTAPIAVSEAPALIRL
jgi:hypothetical protein